MSVRPPLYLDCVGITVFENKNGVSRPMEFNTRRERGWFSNVCFRK